MPNTYSQAHTCITKNMTQPQSQTTDTKQTTTLTPIIEILPPDVMDKTRKFLQEHEIFYCHSNKSQNNKSRPKNTQASQPQSQNGPKKGTTKHKQTSKHIYKKRTDTNTLLQHLKCTRDYKWKYHDSFQEDTQSTEE